MGINNCKPCNSTGYQSSYYSAWQECSTPPIYDGCPTIVDTACISYTGADLTCSGLGTNICLEKILQRYDELLCSVAGNYAGYNVFCLDPVETEKEFVEQISKYVCDLNTKVDDFIGTTFPTIINGLQDQIDNLNNPNITSPCTSIGINVNDNQKNVLLKLVNAGCELYSMLDLSSANWNQCFTIVGTNPKSPLEAVNTLISQICAVKQAQLNNGTIPVFNNTNTCLNGSATDSLETTVIAIRDRLCLTPSIDLGSLNFGCVLPTQTFQTLTQNILNNISGLNQAKAVFDPTSFNIDKVDPSNNCAGVKISLKGAVTSDRLVAASPTDLNPGTLLDKLDHDSNITITLVGEKVKIGLANANTLLDEKVKVNGADPQAGYLIDKIIAVGTSPLSLGAGVLNNQVQISGSINVGALVPLIFDIIEQDSELKARFCALVNACPATCSAPTNASVNFG